MAYYHVCPDCGCNLDPGETCDCKRDPEAREETERKGRKVYGGRIKTTGRGLSLYGDRAVGVG